MWRVLSVCLVVACVEPESPLCDGGIVCPEGSSCATVGGFTTCATPQQYEACEGLVDLDGCNANDDRYYCIDGVCVAPCGNGRIEPGEICDDGNTISGDNCSARCQLEVCGNDIQDVILGEQCDSGVPGVSGEGCSSTCEIEHGEWIDITPGIPTPRAGAAMVEYGLDTLMMFGGGGPDGVLADTWVLRGGQWKLLEPPSSPPGRQYHSLVYDTARQRVVLFGGFGAAGVLGDTWEWDGITWTERKGLPSPPPRFETQLAYDEVRDVVVLHGGRVVEEAVDDTWEWNGTTWTNRTVTPRPPANHRVQLVYDTVAQDVVYVGSGETAGTWRWNGVAWTDLGEPPPSGGGAFESYRLVDRGGAVALFVGTSNKIYDLTNNAWVVRPETLPGSREDMALGYDGSSVMAFGGRAPVTGEILGDLWSLVVGGGTWAETSVQPNVPSARDLMAVATDAVRGRIVMFGGIDGSARTVFTHVLDRLGWSAFVSAIVSPNESRQGAAMTFDRTRNRVVLFGGIASGVPQNDTWLLDNQQWELVMPGTSPSPRRGASMAFDDAREHSILFGGNAGMTLHGDTWRWDGSAWSSLSPAMSPSARSEHAMAYDPVRQRIVLFGGVVGGTAVLAGDTWEWDGTTWAQVATTGPSPRARAGLVYDPLRQKMVLVGGYDRPTNYITYGDWWEWDGTAWTKMGDDPRIARAGHAAFFDSHRGGVVVFSGLRSTLDQGPTSSDQWVLRYSSTAPRERCQLAVADQDGDQLAGCADPDCWGRCSPLCPPGMTCAASAPRCGDGACSELEDYLLCDDDCMP